MLSIANAHTKNADANVNPVLNKTIPELYNM
jgi:hypothetical protein